MLLERNSIYITNTRRSKYPTVGLGVTLPYSLSRKPSINPTTPSREYLFESREFFLLPSSGGRRRWYTLEELFRDRYLVLRLRVVCTLDSLGTRPEGRRSWHSSKTTHIRWSRHHPCWTWLILWGRTILITNVKPLKRKTETKTWKCMWEMNV